MKLDEDQVLVKKILEGKKRAFEELMRKYNRKIYNYILRMVRNEEIAVELTQDFFIKLYTIIAKYNFQYKFSTWAYRICYNLVIDHIRKNQVLLQSLDETGIHSKALNNPEHHIKNDVVEDLEKDERGELLWEVVSTLPEKYKNLILFRYINQLKYEEIAEITGIPVGTVKNRIFKAKKLLREEISKNEMFK